MTEQRSNERTRFQPGNKLATGRPKGSPNKNLREKLLNGLARSGKKKALKAGLNHKIDGFEYFVEHLADTNSSAAASLVSKLIPPEETKSTAAYGPVTIIIEPIASGQQLLPGNCGVLMPFDESTASWDAYRAGPEAWTAWLEGAEEKFTAAAYQKLQAVPLPPEPIDDGDIPKVVPLRLLDRPVAPVMEPEPPPPEDDLADLSPDQRAALEKFARQADMALSDVVKLSDEEGTALALKLGYLS